MSAVDITWKSFVKFLSSFGLFANAIGSLIYFCKIGVNTRNKLLVSLELECLNEFPLKRFLNKYATTWDLARLQKSSWHRWQLQGTFERECWNGTLFCILGPPCNHSSPCRRESYTRSSQEQMTNSLSLHLLSLLLSYSLSKINTSKLESIMGRKSITFFSPTSTWHLYKITTLLLLGAHGNYHCWWQFGHFATVFKH